MLGDFNEIVKLEEMKGRRPRPERQMSAFRETLDNCGLIDRDPPNTTWVCLDRAVANMDWLNHYLAAHVEHVNVINSDHKCIWMQWDPPVSKR